MQHRHLEVPATTPMQHRHLEVPATTPVEELPSAAIVDLLERGDLADWRPLRRAIARDPHGPFAARVMRLLDLYPMYGTSALWRAWISRQRARAEGPPVGPSTAVRLAALRREQGLTQAEVARRTGRSQSDLSKLERRGDVRLSTLRDYARALGGRLRLLFVKDDVQRQVALGASTED